MDLQQLQDLLGKLVQDLKVSHILICSSLFIDLYKYIISLLDDMYSRSAGAAPATGPTPPGTAPQKAGDYAGYGNYTGYQQV